MAASLLDMQMFMYRAAKRIGHEYFHLSNRHLLDVLVLSQRVLDFRLASFRSFFELRVENTLCLRQNCSISPCRFANLMQVRDGNVR
jgi:hypothetical protein